MRCGRYCDWWTSLVSRDIRFTVDRRGNVAVMMAFLLPILAGGVGLGIEGSNWYLRTRAMQNAADSAAIAGLKIMTVSDALKDQSGTSAVEFAIVGPVFLGLVVGIMYVCLSLFLVGSLHYAVEDGARCASVKTGVCPDEPTTEAYTKSRYFGPSSPTFKATKPNGGCGDPNNDTSSAVSGRLDYTVQLGLKEVTIPISATACFP